MAPRQPLAPIGGDNPGKGRKATSAGKARKTSNPVLMPALKGAARWIAAKPETRGVAFGLSSLYLGSGFAAGHDPMPFLAATGPVGIVAATLGARSGGGKWAATVTGCAVAVPGWLAYAAAFGPFNQWSSVGYFSAAAIGWAGVYTSDVAAARRRWKATQVEWSELAEVLDLTGSTLRKTVPDRLGWTYQVDVRGTGKTASAAMTSGIAEKLAMHLGIGKERVRLSLNVKHAAIINLHVQMIDPWEKAILHPLFDSASEITLYSDRTIFDPIPVGMVPETGAPLTVQVADGDGAIHMMVIAATGAGKTVFTNSALEHLTSCPFVDVYGIDIAKGKDLRMWAPVMKQTVTAADGLDAAVVLLRKIRDTIIRRSAASTEAVHTPTAAEPAITLVLDEVGELIGQSKMHPLNVEARELVKFIQTRGRSEMVGTIMMGQRGTLEHFGSGDIKSNAFTQVVLRVRPGGMHHAIPGWQDQGLPDMATYAQGHKGVALVVSPDGTWQVGRTFFLRELEDIRRIVSSRTPGRTPGRTVDPVQPYTEPYARTDEPYTEPYTPAVPVQNEHDVQNRPPRTDVDLIKPVQPVQGDVEKELNSMIQTLQEPAVHTRRVHQSVQHSADEVAADPARQKINTLQLKSDANDRAITIPDHLLAVVRGFLGERPEGALRAELQDVMNLSRSQSIQWLRVMVAQGVLSKAPEGDARATLRYSLAPHAE